MSDLIRVRSLEDRVARNGPQGKIIPHDSYVLVKRTAYIDRLLNVHGDIEEEPAKAAPPRRPAKAAPKPPAEQEPPAQTNEEAG